MDFTSIIGAAPAALALLSLGGGFFEVLVVDPVWPNRIDIIQPDRGGLSRKRFWIPAHVMFELALAAALVTFWSSPAVRAPLLIALASHATMRIWSAFDFIPKALAFERMVPEDAQPDAMRRWTRRSRLRFLLDFVTCGATIAAFVAVIQQM